MATTGNDYLIGTTAADTLDGLAGDDTLSGGAGNDLLIGGGGNDVAVFNSSYSNYTIARNLAGNLTVSASVAGSDGSDVLVSIETLKFTDATVMAFEAGSSAELKVNNTYNAVGGAKVTRLPDGGWVTIWSNGSSNQPATLYGKRYDAAGSPVGSEFSVNPARTGSYDYGHHHSISALSDGGWVVTWAGLDSSSYGLYGQRFSSSGTASGGVFAVNTTTSLSQLESSVTGLSDGGWLCVWKSQSQDGSLDGVVMRRFSAQGVGVAESIVNTTTTNYQQQPSVAALPNGGWVVVWQSLGQDAANSMGIYGQAYTSTGSKLNGEFRINTTTAGDQQQASVAALADGGWVVVWQLYGQGVLAQRYSATGAVFGGETQINTYTTGDPQYPSVTALKDGGYVVVWESYGRDGSGFGIYGQRYGVSGVAVGGEFRINATTDGDQSRPTVAALEDGGWVVSWMSGSAATGKDGIIYQRYTANGAAVSTDFSLSVTGAMTWQSFTGTAYSDTLSGLGGDDTLNGGAGSDSLIGGIGNDAYYVDNAGDQVVEGVGEGTDIIYASTSFTLPSNVENITLTGAAAATATGNELDNLIYGNLAANTINGGIGADQMLGGDGDDVYLVDNKSDWVGDYSNQGFDQVISSVDFSLQTNTEMLTLTGVANLVGGGNSQNNTLVGNAGIDTLSGGLGDDTYVIGNASTVINEFVLSGTDVVRSNFSHVLRDNVENLVLLGSSDIAGTGNASPNAIVGNAGSNTLDGGGGADTLTGGAGNDLYIVNVSTDVIVEQFNEGVDEVRSSAPYTLSGNVEILTLLESANLMGAGNALNNTLTGNSGTDTLLGGAGDDLYIVNNTADQITELSGDGTGIDEVRSHVTYTLSANVEKLTLTGSANIVGTGNASNNTITSNWGVNTLIGGGGDDTYYVDQSADLVIEVFGGGAADEINSTANYVLPDQVEKLTLSGWTALNATGNALNNTITGNTLANSLLGGAGNDSIDGSLGADTMVGGTGDDVYYIDDVNDKVIESAGEGTDFVSSYFSYVLTDAVENLQLSGSNATNGTGNALSNEITGNDGANSLAGGDGNDTLNGGAGADTLVGGAGDDVYLIAETTDVVVEAADAGTDSVFTAVTYRLSSALENLTITSGAAVDGIGNALGNVITGSYGANMLAGAAGHDTLTGGAGADTLAGGLGYDTAVFSGKISDYVISQNTTTGGIAYTVADQRQGMDATDLVIGVERLKFSDGVIQLVQTASAVTLPDLGVNTYKTGSQTDPAVAGFDDGSFVVTWMSYGYDTSVWGVSGQRYNAAGLPQGSEFIINTTTFDGQYYPSVTGLPDQGFVVTWESQQLDGSGLGIVGQRFDALGQKSGSEFLVNNVYKLNAQSGSSVVGLADGGFAVVWQSSGVDGSGYGVCGRLYAATGLPRTDEFKINTTTTGDQVGPSVAALTNGGFVTTWRQTTTVTSGTTTTTSITLNAQRYDNLGNKNGAEFRVGTRTGVSSADVAGLSDGGFVVTYGSGSSVYAQRYSSTGTFVSDTKVNVSTNSCTDPHVVSNPAGGYVITWTSATEDGNGSGVYGRSYAADGSSQGPFRVNDNTTGDQRDSGLAIAGDSLVVAWDSSTIHDGDSTGIAIRRFDLNGKQLWSRFDVTGDSSAQLLTGSEYGESIIGLEGADTLYGLAGNDSLDGGAGADSMIGGAGNDAYWVDHPNDRIVEELSAGTDTVFASADFALQDNVENLILAGSNNLSAWGNSLANSLTGNAGNNSLYGGANNDTYSGGAGDDVYAVADYGDVVIEIAGEGVDTVISAIDYTLPSEVENLTLVNGSSYRGTGNALANFIVSGGGNDTLDGGLGIDSYTGGAGDDVYYINSTDEVIVENDLEGIDTVYSSVSYTLGDNLENLRLSGASGATGVGNTLANYLTGSASKNLLSGEGGNDTLDGVNGVNGGDTLAGGVGDDTYIINNSTDIILEKDGEGVDTARSTVNYSIDNTYVDNLVLVSGFSATGNALSNYIEGNSSNNTINGLAGADTMAGMQGSDIYYVDDVGDLIVEASSAGTDAVISTVSFKLDANVESLTLIGAANLSGTGNDLANTIQGAQGENLLDGAGGDDLLYAYGGNDTLLGGAGNDYLDGDEGNDYLDGGIGNDTLVGGLGQDTLSGGAGNDIYYVNEASDLVIEAVGAGTDTIYSSISYRLGDYQENLYLLGSDALSATGNTFANAIYGNSGDNLIEGLGGVDTLQGGEGNDTLVGGAGNADDVLIGGGGVDVARFTGNFSTYQINYAATGGILVSGLDGRDTLTGIEVLQFSDTTLKLGVVTQTAEASTDAGSLALNFSGMTLSGHQIGRSNQSAQIADGGTVRVYESSLDVYLERLKPDGSQLSAPSMVNTSTTNSQLAPSVTALGDGGWYVVWWSNAVPAQMGIWGQRYSATGSRIGYPSPVDTYGQIYSNTTTRPVITSLADGGWVVAYETWWQDGSDYGISAQRFNSSGARVGSEFQVNLLSTIGAQYSPSVYGLVDGGWVITWNDRPTNSSPTTLMFKRFDASGAAVPVGGSGYTFDFKGDDTNQVFLGSSNADTLDGGAGVDTLSGGRGDDFYIVDHVADKVVELVDEGRDSISSSVSFALPDNVESLTLTGSGNVNGTGNTGTNLITGNSGNNTLDGGEGGDTLIGGQGDDVYVLGPIASGGYVDVVVESVNSGLDTVRVSASYTLPVNVENLVLTGDSYFSATGNALDNLIVGNDYGNELSGGLGADTLIGGKGSDTYIVDVAVDKFIEMADEGSDTLVVTSSYALPDNFENLVLTGSVIGQLTGNAVDNVLAGNSAANTLDGGAGNDTLRGGAGNDVFLVDSESDLVIEIAGDGSDIVRSTASYVLSENVEHLYLDGTASISGKGNAIGNMIVGNSGDNTLDGGEEADWLSGGAGNDTYLIDHVQDIVVEAAGEGRDDVLSTIDYVLGDNLDNLTLIGNAAQLATGNALNNVLRGNDLANTLDGGAGIDTLEGGAGDDVYQLASDADVVIEQADLGIDTVRTGLAYTLGDNLENLELLDGANIDGKGNSLSNVLTGNAGNNRLDGLGGDDTLNGLSGRDTLVGGDGDDTYVIDNAADVVIELANQGRDRIIASVSYALTDAVEDMQLVGSLATAATGNSRDNVLTGSDGDNTLDGGAGADTLTGGSGSDTFIVDSAGDVVIESAAPGIDEVRASIDYSLDKEIENLSLLGSASLRGRGNSGNNKIIGNAGNNTLNGGLGADTLSGSAGDDVYVVDNAGDVVIEKSGEGVDEVRSSVSIVLTDNVENLSLTGDASVYGTGNQLNNVITGNGADNTLIGGAGFDTMVGGSGDDVYLVTEDGDSVVEALNSGRDEVRSTVSYSLTENVENLVLLGSASMARGNALDNTIYGNAENNSIDGAAGSDFMAGGAGDDLYVVDSTGDRVTEAEVQGIDEVRASITYTLTDQVENLTLTGSVNLSGFGNGLDNAITGNYGNNTLDGGVGADTLSGGIGDDLYLADNGNDVVVEARDAGVDEVSASVSYILSDHVDNLSLVGSARSGTGNALDNVISGNSADNLLSGLDGNDTFKGAGGNDTFMGGSGDDVYFVDSVSDTVVETNVVGRDRIYSRVAYNLVDNVEELVLDNVAGAASITGNALDNYIVGNAAENNLIGGTGNDTLIGGGASSSGDTLDGGFGADVLMVSGGNNLLTGYLAADRFEFSGIVNTQNTITDFEIGDTLQISDLTEITSFASGTSANLSRGQVSYKTVAGSGTDLFVGMSNAGEVAVIHLKGFSDADAASLKISGNSLGVNINSSPKGAPTITGTATEGITLVASETSLSDSDGINAGSFAWQWQRSTVQGGWQSIVGATATSFLLTQADVGYKVRVVASYTDGKGVRESKAAEATVVVANVNDLPTSFDVQVDGGTSVGASLTTFAWAVDEDGVSGQYAFQWQRGNDADRNGVYADNEWLDITGATNANYQVAMLDSGRALRVSVSYVDLLGTRESKFSRILTLDSTGGEIFSGDDSPDEHVGTHGRDSIRGGGGDDRLYGSYGDDVLQGDAGNDQLEGDQGDDTLQGGAGNDYLIGGTGFDLLQGGSGNDTLNGVIGADTMDGGDGNDVYFVDDPSDVVTDSGSMADNDVVFLLFSQANRYTLGVGIDAAQLSDSTSLAVLEGNDGNNLLGGNASANELIGGAGNDSLNGGNGMDTLFGGSGNDIVSGDAGNDLLIGGDGAGDDTYVGGEGIDTIKYTSALAGITVDLSRQSNQAYSTEAGDAAGIGIDQLFGIENVIAGNFADNLSGNAANNTFTGGSGNDTINGGNGIDTAIYTGRSADYIVTTANGRVTVQAKVGGDGTDILTSIESLQFSGSNTTLDLQKAGTVIVAGSAVEGGTLSASAAFSNADGLGTFGYQWLANGVSIAGATSSALQLAQQHVGALISVKVSYTDSLGSAQSVTSAVTVKVLNVNNAPTGAAVITGDARENATLTVGTSTIADADGLGKFAFQWQRLVGNTWIDIGKATTTSYKMVAADIGYQIRAKVSYTDAQKTAEVVYSASTNAVANVNDAPVGVPTIVGTLVEGSKLTAAAKITDLDGVGSFNYRWEMFSSGSWTTVGTGISHTLFNDSMGKQVRVVVSYNDKQGTAESVTSTTSVAIATKALTLAGTPNADVLNGMSGADTLNGNAGNDSLFGNSGADKLTGGLGADTFIYNAITDSSLTTGVDTIIDFTAGDKINLAAIDANTKLAADQAFAFSTVGASNAVWTMFNGTDTLVYADNTGDASADLTIKLIGKVSLTATDFIL